MEGDESRRDRNAGRLADRGTPFVTAYMRRLDLRNHRKITVIDGQILHCGSQNCTNFFYPIKPKYAPWIDVMVRFDGPVARQMDLLLRADMVRG